MLDRRTLLQASALAAAGAVLPSQLTSPALAQATVPQKLTVLLDWFMNPDHAPLVVARDKGYFAKAGLDVTLVPPADPSAPPRLVAAKQADIAITYQPNLYLQVKESLPLVRFGTLVATPLNTLVVLKGGPVRTLADLKGKTIGFSVGGFEDALLATMLSTVGLTLKDVKLVNVNFALSQSLIAGRVDAVIGAFRNFELTQLRLEKREGLAFFPEEHGVPPYDELIYVAHRDRLAGDDLRRFLDALEQATVYLFNHPEECWKLFIKAYPKLDDALNRQAWTDTLPRFAHAPGALDPRKYERFAAFMKAQGLIDTVPPLDTYAVTLR
jgi:putative hydroxymethylpyrimidine transport system substrate-binding protein